MKRIRFSTGPRIRSGMGIPLLATLMACALAVSAQAAEAPEPPTEPPAAATEEPRLESEGILLNFRDASLEAVLDYLSEAAGFVVVTDAYLDGRVTIVSRKSVSPDEAVELLNSVLKDRGYMALQMGRTLKILPLSEAKTANVPVRSGNDPERITPSDRFITQVIPLRYVDAKQLQVEIATMVPSYANLTSNESSNALILTDTEANVRRMVEIVRALDTHMSSVVDVKVFQLEYAEATNAARLINEVFEQDQPASQQGGAMGGFRRFRGGGPGGDDQRGGSPQSQKVTASADDRTNTVVVSGPPDVLAVVEEVVRKLDSNPTAEQAVFIYRLKNATAENLEAVLNELFSENRTAAGAAGGAGGAGGGRGGRNGGGQGGPREMFARMMQNAGAAQSATDLAGQVFVVADEDTNSLMVMTPSRNIERVREIIVELDMPVPQVLIKVLIAEVTHTRTRDMGVEGSALDFRPSGLGNTVFTDFDVEAASGGLVFKLVEADVTAALRALEEVGNLDVLSRPYILASDNQASNITVGQEVPFIRNTRTTETGQTINTIEYEDIGIILDVTPHVNADGLVTLDVVPEISTLTGDTVPISETVSAPVFAKRSATSRIAIYDGQTIVIGGLMEDKKTDTIRKVPFVGDIPLFGRLFSRTITEKTKTELLIFLTPHVAQEADLLEYKSREEEAAATAVQQAVEPGAYQRHMEGMNRGAAQE